ncbi:hypothetical protein ACFL35_20570 [Candidatus Riflebacteria bacterium]
MKLFEKISINYEEHDYEIQIFYDDMTINAVTFQNNYPAFGFRHQLKLSNKLNIEELLEKKIHAGLVEMCKKDIFEKRWEKVKAIIG